jgi:hypothetical protein
MLKVNDYCFRVERMPNPFKPNTPITSIQIFRVIELLNRTQMSTQMIDTYPQKYPKVTWDEVITMSHYTKCSSTTIEELKEEFPEVFI